jgi:hypothetical protein
MKVDDICDAVSSSTDPRRIRLVFLRYTGPFRPSTKTLRSVEERVDGSNGYKDRTNTSGNTKPMKKKAPFRLFGKGKKKPEI